MPTRRNSRKRPRKKLSATTEDENQCEESGSVNTLPSTPPDHVSAVNVETVPSEVGRLLLDSPKARPKPCAWRQKGRVLCFLEEQPQERALPKWSEEELLHLASFLVKKSTDSWITARDIQFWEEAAVYIQQSLQAAHRRSGMACYYNY